MTGHDDPSTEGASADPSTTAALPPGWRRCTARSRRNGGRRCRACAVTGADVCQAHGGRAPQVKAAAARRVQREKAEKIMVKVLGVDAPLGDVDPVRAILSEIGYASAACGWLREQVGELDPHAAVWGTVQEIDRTSGENPGTDTTRAARPHVLVEMLADWSDRLVRHCRAASQMGVDASLIAATEALGVRAALVLEDILAGEAEIPPEVRRRMLSALPERLRAVAP